MFFQATLRQLQKSQSGFICIFALYAPLPCPLRQIKNVYLCL
nr:MAG TPA: hypothetical protein [Caudoviricetes sp.]